MIRIAVFPKCWIKDICSGKMPLFEWFKRSSELQCDGLELYAGFLKSFDRAYIKWIREELEKAGTSAPMMCYSPDFTNPDAEARRNEVEKQIETVRITAELGGKYCRTLSGQSRPNITTKQGIEWVVSCIGSCLAAAERYGVKLVIENHYKDDYWQ